MIKYLFATKNGFFEDSINKGEPISWNSFFDEEYVIKSIGNIIEDCNRLKSPYVMYEIEIKVKDIGIVVYNYNIVSRKELNQFSFFI